MEDYRKKTEVLREKYKEYLKPIDPLRPLGREPSELMPPPGKKVQTCFNLKEKFPRGEELIRTLGKRTMLDRLEEYNQFKVPLQCPCQAITQGGDPARKKKRGIGPTKAKKPKKEPQHIVCSVNNLPPAFSDPQPISQPTPVDTIATRYTNASLPTAAPVVRNIKRDKDISQQAITSQRKYIRAKAAEIQKKSVALQQKMAKPKASPTPKKTLQKKPNVDDSLGGVKLKRTAPKKLPLPKRPAASKKAAALKKQPKKTATLAASSTLPVTPRKTAGGKSNQLPNTSNMIGPSSMPTTPGKQFIPQQMQQPTTPTMGRNTCVLNTMPTTPGQAFVAQQLQQPITPTTERCAYGLNPMPTTPGKQFMPQQPTTPTTGRSTCGAKSMPNTPGKQSIPQQMHQPTFATMRRNSCGPYSMPTTPAQPCIPQQKQQPATPTDASLCGITAKRTNPTRLMMPAQKPLQTTATMEGNAVAPNSMPTLAGQRFGPQQKQQTETPMDVSLCGITSKRTNTTRPVVPLQKLLQSTSAMGGSSSGHNSMMPTSAGKQFVPQQKQQPETSIDASLCGITSKRTNPTRPVVPAQKQAQVTPAMGGSSSGRNSKPTIPAKPFVSETPIDGSLCGITSKRTKPTRLVVPAQKQIHAAAAMGGSSSGRNSKPTSGQQYVPQHMQPASLRGSSCGPISMAATAGKLFVPQQKPPQLTTPSDGSLSEPTSKRTGPTRNVVPPQKQPQTTLAMGEKSMPTIAGRSSLATTASMGGKSFGLNLLPTIPGQHSNPQQPRKPFVPLQMQPSTTPNMVDSLLGITSRPTNPRRPVVPPKKPIANALSGTENLLGITSKPTNPRRPAVPPKKPIPNTLKLNENILGITSKPTNPRRPVVPPKKPLPNTLNVNENMLGITLKPTNPRRPVVPSLKQMPKTSTMGDSLLGIISKPTNPRRPVVPPRKQQSTDPTNSGIIEMPTTTRRTVASQQLPKGPTVVGNKNGLNSMPALDWFD